MPHFDLISSSLKVSLHPFDSYRNAVDENNDLEGLASTGANARGTIRQYFRSPGDRRVRDEWVQLYIGTANVNRQWVPQSVQYVGLHSPALRSSYTVVWVYMGAVTQSTKVGQSGVTAITAHWLQHQHTEE